MISMGKALGISIATGLYFKVLFPEYISEDYCLIILKNVVPVYVNFSPRLCLRDFSVSMTPEIAKPWSLG